MAGTVQSNERVFDLDIGGAVFFDVENPGSEAKSATSPIGLTLWASRDNVGPS